ncbi:hypothetical protein F2Q70_00012954 [Brassica cretica]|uniref:Uncharacterized protein n=1 Tax=Brassica cretica TaxID=69181 RepID=A0A8S9LS60_BRACR|nr:hypothetical protein F2Q70_00012954 [Brassica cretica]
MKMFYDISQFLARARSLRRDRTACMCGSCTMTELGSSVFRSSYSDLSVTGLEVPFLATPVRGFSAQLWVLVLEVHKCRVMAAFLSGGAANSTCFAVRLELGFGFKRCVALCASPALALHYSGDDMGNSGIRDNKGNLTFPWCSSKVENGN